MEQLIKHSSCPWCGGTLTTYFSRQKKPLPVMKPTYNMYYHCADCSVHGSILNAPQPRRKGGFFSSRTAG